MFSLIIKLYFLFYFFNSWPQTTIYWLAWGAPINERDKCYRWHSEGTHANSVMNQTKHEALKKCAGHAVRRESVDYHPLGSRNWWLRSNWRQPLLQELGKVLFARGNAVWNGRVLLHTICFLGVKKASENDSFSLIDIHLVLLIWDKDIWCPEDSMHRLPFLNSWQHNDQSVGKKWIDLIVVEDVILAGREFVV